MNRTRTLTRQKLDGSYQTLVRQVLCIDNVNGIKTRNLNLFEQQNCKHAMLYNKRI